MIEKTDDRGRIAYDRWWMADCRWRMQGLRRLSCVVRPLSSVVRRLLGGLLVDFSDVKRVLRAIVERLDHQFLNDVPPFDQLNPSAENMARYFYEECAKELKGVAEVRIWETDTAIATYRLP
jgi:hypothetical protein